jgi:hypothetical protein
MRRFCFLLVLLLLLAPLGCGGPQLWYGEELPDLEDIENSSYSGTHCTTMTVDSQKLELESQLQTVYRYEKIDGHRMLCPFFRIKLRQLPWAEGRLWGYSVRYGIKNAQSYDAHGKLAGVSEGLPVRTYHSRKLENDRWITLPSLPHPYYSNEYSGRPANAMFFMDYLAIYQREGHLPQVIVASMTSPVS